MAGRDRSPGGQAEAQAQADADAQAQKQADLDARKKAAAARVTALNNGSRSGVFSLEDLRALGQTGDAKTDWAAGAPAQSGLIAGGGRAAIPPGTPAGYYQIPGQDGAQYYDPASGQVSQELADYLSTAKR